MPYKYTNDTRNMLEGYFNGQTPLERKKPAFGESKNYFIDPNDSTQTIEVPDGTDPYQFRDAGYKSQSLTDIGSGLTTETGTGLNTSLTNNSSTSLTDQTGIGSNSLNTSTGLFGNKTSSNTPSLFGSTKTNTDNPWAELENSNTNGNSTTKYVPNVQTNPREFTEYILRTKGYNLPQHNWKDNLAEQMVTSTGGRYLGMALQGMANANLNPFKYAAKGLGMDLKPLTPTNTTERLIEAGAESATDGLILGGFGNVAASSGLLGKTVQASEIIKKAGDIRSAESVLQYAPRAAKIANKYLNQNMYTQGLISMPAGVTAEGLFPTEETNTFEDNAMRTGTELVLKPTLKTLVQRSAIGIEPILKKLIR